MNQQVSEPSLDAIPLVLKRAAGCAAGCGHFLPEIRCSAVGLSCRFSGRFSTAIFWARQQCRLRTAQRQRFGSRGLRAQTESIASSEDDHFHRCGVDAHVPQQGGAGDASTCCADSCQSCRSAAVADTRTCADIPLCLDKPHAAQCFC